MANNVVEMRPGIMRHPDEVDENSVLDNTGAMHLNIGLQHQRFSTVVWMRISHKEF